MFETIIWATDGSETADRALPYATGLAEGKDKALVVVHIREILTGRGGGYPVYADEDELLEKIEAQVEELRKSGIAVTLKTATAATFGPAHYVAELAEQSGADVIVVGTRGHGPVAGALLGSVAQRLLHDAHLPVLAVPPQKPAKLADVEDEPVEAAVGV
jgi:nucleotide-binding universal stress UspA family protein